MKWISVKDRLPEITEVVLTFWNCGKYSVMCYTGNEGKSWYNEKGKYENVYHNVGAGLFECITHWMPLPEPPNKSVKKT